MGGEVLGGGVVLQIYWEQFLQNLFSRTEKFPRHVRFTLTSRVDNLGLEILERIVEARFQRRRRAEALQEASLLLEKLRVLLRISHGRNLLSVQAMEQLCRDVDEAGRMLGGWIKQQNQQGEGKG